MTRWAREIKYKGKVYSTLSELAREYGVKPATLLERVREYGWPLHKAVAFKHDLSVTYKGKRYDNLKVLCNKYNRDSEIVARRLRAGDDIDQAMAHEAKTGSRGIAVSHSEYSAFLKQHGMKPIDKYKGSLSASSIECLTCGFQRTTALSDLKRAINKGHKLCSACSGTRFTDKTYRIELKKKHPTIVLIGKFVNKGTRARHECLTCGHRWMTLPWTLTHSSGGCGNCSRSKNSTVAIEWLQAIERRKGRNILHAGNGPEQTIKGVDGYRFLRVDGFDPKTNTVYEFYGDAYHGNLEIYDEDARCHPFNKSVTAKELYDQTMKREAVLRKSGFKVVSIWENDYRSAA